MLRSVAEVSDLTGLSKVSIYNKLKLKEMEEFIVKNKGITYITDEGLNLIKSSLNLKESSLNLNQEIKTENEESLKTVENKGFEEFKEYFKELNKSYLTSLKCEIESLKGQLIEKDKQINDLHKLIENSQVLLKEEQKKSENQLYLAEHFEEVDMKLQDIREKMLNKKSEEKSFFRKIFK